MGDDELSDSQDQQVEKYAWSDLVPLFIARATIAFGNDKTPWALAAIVAIFQLGEANYVWSLLEVDRITIGRPSIAIADAIHELFKSDYMAWGGWILSVLCILVFVPTYLVLKKRIRTQGRENANLKKRLHPNRVSSNSPKSISDYAENVKKEIGADDDDSID